MTSTSLLRPDALYGIRPNARLCAGALLLSASSLALASVPAQGAEMLFSSHGRNAEVETGQRTRHVDGVLQLRLDNGATVSFVDSADFTLNGDGSLTLHEGSVTVVGAGNSTTVVRLPAGVEGRVGGAGNAASFEARSNGESSGHTLNGRSTITRGGERREFAAGQMWESRGQSGIRQVIARESQPTPGNASQGTGTPEVADMGAGGPVAAAENGLPVSLGDALAAAGASSDVVALGRRIDAVNGNPVLDTYPVGDLAQLVGLATGLAGFNGGTPFPAAQADIIRTYLRYLANGGSGAQFLTVYAGFLAQYLDLIRAGGTPSQFGAASQADINAFLRYQANLGRLASLSAQNRALAEAYLAFIQNGGSPDLFASSYTDLVTAYFAFVRGGGDPAQFAGASQQVLDAYIAFLAESGLAQLLSEADQQILAAYLESGGFAFASTYAEALRSYYDYLRRGGLPSASPALTPEQLRAYLDLLDRSGLFAQLLGDQAPFYAAFLAFLNNGGDADQFSQLNANIFAGYASQLEAYFAFLQAGGLPSAYSAADPDLLAQYLAALAEADALEAFLGANAGFFAQYLAFLQEGGNIDTWPGLNANIFAGYASALDAYYTYLAQGGLPSAYTALTQEQIAAYVAALQAVGAAGAFLGGLADFFADYVAYLQGGGNPDVFAGLPALNLPAFADALNAYAAFLAGGGLPGDYTGAALNVLAIYFDALERAGELAALLGANADLLADYFAFLAGGGDPDLFAGLPVYQGYVSALQAYFAFLEGGGLPGDYTALTPQQIQAYLAALSAAGGLALQLGDLADFFTAFYAHLSGGGSPASFAGLPIYQTYVAALNDYYAFLAAGGLPGDYTALTQEQIAAYLAALANVQGGLASFASLNSFFAGYYAYLLGGGDPDDFAGLPLYAQYLAALQAFYAYLAAGGLPSAYTALTQEQVQAYLAALDALGLLAANFQGNVLTFWTNYLAYLAGGGVPDQFSGLPGGGGSGSPVLTGYTGGFDATAPKIFFRTSLSLPTGFVAGGESGFDATAYTLDSNGGLLSYTRTGGTTRTRGTMSQTDVFGNADALIGRWTNGTNTGGNPFTLNANQGFHYVLTRPVASGFALPASGVIHYDLLAATQPTIVDGSLAPGTFTGDMAIVLGAQNRIAMEATITMSGLTLQYATLGGIANPQLSQTNLTVYSDFGFQFFVPGSGGNANCASDTCYLWGNGAFAGDADTLGLSYGAYHLGGSSKTVIGAAIFGNGTLSGSGSGQAPGALAATTPPAEWDRWEVSGSLTGSAPGAGNATGIAPGLGQLMALDLHYSPDQLAQLDAWIAAQGRGY